MWEVLGLYGSIYNILLRVFINFLRSSLISSLYHGQDPTLKIKDRGLVLVSKVSYMYSF